jgi:pimeloyl-ACP methyl ester carboxylesterase
MTDAARPYSTAGFRRDEYDVDGVRTVVYSAGEGPPVVYFHGGGTWHGFEWTRDWLDRFRVILPYHPGFGESGDAAHVHSIHDHVAHYARLFGLLGVAGFDLVGASLGGWMAAQFALTHGALLRRLVLVSPAGLLSAQHPYAAFGALAPEERAGYLATDPAFIERFWPVPAGASLQALLEREAIAAGRVLQGLVAADRMLRQRLRRLSLPVLVMWGELDRLLPAGLAGEWASLLPDARVEIVARGGHLLFDEFPAARAAAARFLA